MKIERNSLAHQNKGFDINEIKKTYNFKNKN